MRQELPAFLPQLLPDKPGPDPAALRAGPSGGGLQGRGNGDRCLLRRRHHRPHRRPGGGQAAGGGAEPGRGGRRHPERPVQQGSERPVLLRRRLRLDGRDGRPGRKGRSGLYGPAPPGQQPQVPEQLAGPCAQAGGVYQLRPREPGPGSGHPDPGRLPGQGDLAGGYVPPYRAC